MKNNRLIQQKGYFLIIAVIFILVIGLLGSIIVHLFSERAQLSVNQLNGLNAFYIAESGVEIGTHLVTMSPTTGTPTRIACASVSGTSSITDATLASGQFTITTINSSPIHAITTLSAALTTSTSTISLTSSTGFAPSGRIMIDNEMMDYSVISGNSLLGVTRGVSGTLASSHTSGASVSQYQCSLQVQSGIPTLTSPKYQRELQWNVQLQDGFVVENTQLSNFMFNRWNYPTEIAWNSSSLSNLLYAANLNAISMTSSGDGWAVGVATLSNLILLRFNGSAWTLNTISGACSGQDLYGVSTVSSQEAWAVGARYRPSCVASGAYRYNIMKWNGSSWTVLTTTTSPSTPANSTNNQNLNAVHVIDTNGTGTGDIGFAVGNTGTILQYNGSNWVTASSPTTKSLLGVYVVSASEAWAVGASGTILKWNGTTWSTFSSPVTTNMNSIAMLDSNGNGTADAGWIAANSGQVISYNGSTWTLVADVGSNNLLGIDYFNSNDVWAVGAAGFALHWNGSTWASISTGTTLQINGISLISPGKSSASNWKQVFR